MSRHSSLYLGTTSLIEVDGLTNDQGVYQNNATVTLQSLVDRRTGTAVSGLTVPLSMAYVAGSNGKYQAVLPHTVSVTPGRLYDATVLAISSSGQRRTWYETCVSKKGRA